MPVSHGWTTEMVFFGKNINVISVSTSFRFGCPSALPHKNRIFLPESLSSLPFFKVTSPHFTCHLSFTIAFIVHWKITR